MVYLYAKNLPWVLFCVGDKGWWNVKSGRSCDFTSMFLKALSSNRQNHILHIVFSVQVPRTEIWHSLNATIVGLASSCDTPATAHAIPWCVGLGIVRGIDVQRGLLYVITPVAVEHLQSVDLLLQGLIEIPRSVLQVKGCESPYMSTNVRDKITGKDLYASNLNSPLSRQDDGDSDSDADTM
uniref:NOL9 C-terminal domain-containing protein n=1 Tax=Aegilops tauschii subsp. strangulata TaxID=200361 RepID=A0A453E819_AEGTS